MSREVYMDYSDDRLMKLMAEGDQSAFSVIYKRHWATLYNAAYKRLKNHSQCQDVVQNSFTDLWVRREGLAIDNLPAFLHGAVRFQVYKLAHKAKIRSDFFNSFDVVVNSEGGDHVLLEAELKELLAAWMEALPPKRRRIFEMRYEQGLSTGEIADVLKISQKTVQNQLNTATTDLTAKLARFSAILIAFIPHC